jgi:repressor LexA
MLTAKQHELLLFIHKHLEESGISPSFEEMKEALDLKSKSGVHRLIGALEERGFIRRLVNRARALEVVKMPEGGTSRPSNITKLTPAIASNKAQVNLPVAANDVLEIPLHGKIAAGVPIEALEGQNSLSVPMALLGSGEHYALEVSGDSMVEAGILDGDYALIKKASTARDGEIVVALVRGEEATLIRQTRFMNRNISSPMKSKCKESWLGYYVAITDLSAVRFGRLLPKDSAHFHR